MGNLTRLMAKNYNTMQTILLNNGIHMPLLGYGVFRDFGDPNYLRRIIAMFPNV